MVYLAVLFILTGVLIILIALFSNIQKSTIRIEDEPENEVEISSQNQEIADEDSSELKVPEDDVVFPSFGSESHEYDRFSQNTPTTVLDDKISSSSPEEDVFLSFEDENEEKNKNDLHDEVNEEELLSDWEGAAKIEDDSLSVVADSLSQSDIFEEREDPIEEIPEEKSEYEVTLFDDLSNIIDYDRGDAPIDSTSSAYKRIKRVGSGKLQVDEDGVSFDLQGKLYRFDFHKVYDVWSGENFVALPLKGSQSVKLFLSDEKDDLPERMESLFLEFNKG